MPFEFLEREGGKVGSALDVILDTKYAIGYITGSNWELIRA